MRYIRLLSKLNEGKGQELLLCRVHKNQGAYKVHGYFCGSGKAKRTSRVALRTAYSAAITVLVMATLLLSNNAFAKGIDEDATPTIVDTTDADRMASLQTPQLLPKEKADQELVVATEQPITTPSVSASPQEVASTDYYSEDFRDKFNNLPPAVKLSLLINTFKHSALP